MRDIEEFKNMLNVGEKIRQRRLELGMTQEELAHKAGYKSRASINKIELERDMPLKKAKLIADALDIDVWNLVGWNTVKDEEVELLAKLIKDQPSLMYLNTIHNDKALSDAVQKIIKMDASKRTQVFNFVDFLLNQS